MPVVAIVNQKGGVGKTTVTLGLAAAAWAAGRPTLVVDIDPQANTTTGLGVWDPRRTIDDVLSVERRGAALDAVMAAAWPDGGRVPDLIASTPALAAREPQLANDPIGAQDRLAVALEGVGHPLVLIDCPPSLGLLTVNGLFAADAALVVTEPAAWASDGVDQILQTIERISARRGRTLRLAGITVNRLGRTRDAKYWNEQLAEAHAGRMLPAIRLRAAIAEASAQARPIHDLVPRSGAAEAAAEFDALLAELDVRSTGGSHGHL